MIAFIDWLFAVFVSFDFLFGVLSVIGVYATCWWLIDNLKSVVQVISTLLTPFFQPNEDKTLAERYGQWAGNRTIIIIII